MTQEFDKNEYMGILVATAAKVKQLTDETTEVIEASLMDVAGEVDFMKFKDGIIKTMESTYSEEEIMDWTLEDMVMSVLSCFPAIDIVGEVYATESAINARRETVAKQKKDLLDIAQASMNQQLQIAIDNGFGPEDSMDLPGTGKIQFSQASMLEIREDYSMKKMEKVTAFINAIKTIDEKLDKYLIVSLSKRGMEKLGDAIHEQELAGISTQELSKELDALQMNKLPVTMTAKFTPAKERAKKGGK